MSDIQPGDMVMVVHACCKPTEVLLGKVLEVAAIRLMSDTGKCRLCGFVPTDKRLLQQRHSNITRGTGAWRVKKLPPMEDPIETNIPEELHA